jgi:single-strand DNA-binding protein
VRKGDRLVVTGRLRIRDYEGQQGKGTDVEIDAEAIGHDLTWGTSTFQRPMASSGNLGETPSESSEVSQESAPPPF